jgi:hypothetical protein
MGGEYLLKLNISLSPIAYKYREGKLQRTLKREFKEPEIANGEGLGRIAAARNTFFFCSAKSNHRSRFFSASGEAMKG